MRASQSLVGNDPVFDKRGSEVVKGLRNRVGEEERIHVLLAMSARAQAKVEREGDVRP